jgi:hypothetical protein
MELSLWAPYNDFRALFVFIGLILLGGILVYYTMIGMDRISYIFKRRFKDHLLKKDYRDDEAALSLMFFGTLAVLWFTATGIAGLLTRHSSDILATLERWYTIPVALLVGLLFFLLRSRAPFLYGLSEVFAATISIIYSTSIQNSTLLAKGVALLGGIYIFVRGLDNMDKRLNGKNRLWTRFFWGRKIG